MENKDTAQKFMERNQHEGRIVVQSALVELWSRHQSALNEIELLKQALAGYANYMEDMDNRLKKLEPTIQVFGANEIKTHLKDISK